MKKTKLFNYAMAGILSAGLIGGLGTHALAAGSSASTSNKAAKALDAATLEKAETIKENLSLQLAKLGVTLPEHGKKGNWLSGLDDATKTKAETILEKEKAGTITHDEAKTQLGKLGVTLPERKGHGGTDKILDGLDSTTKEKAEALFEKEKAGTITRDEAKTELEKLGVTLPDRNGHGGADKILDGLDSTTKEKAAAILEKEKAGTLTRDEAKTQLMKLGVTLPVKGERDHKEDPLANLDSATKEKAKKLMDEAQAELDKLGAGHKSF